MSAMGNVFGSTNNVGGAVVNLSNDVIQTPIDKLKRDLGELIIQHDYGRSVSLEENERGVIIRILDDILFPSGRAELSFESREVLSNLASIIRQLPNDIRIEGHTDNVQINTSYYPSNWHLSVARALNTAYFLIKDEGLSPDKVSIVGYSEYKPIDDNESLDGRAHNRRVDIVIINN